MSDRRYLERGFTGSIRPSLHEQLSLRDQDDLAHYGNAGRVKRESSCCTPGRKRWFQAYNVQAQDNNLVETYPVGLRGKRATATWVFLALMVIGNIVVLACTINLFVIINTTEYGPKNMRIKGDAVAFTGDFGADELYVSDESPVVQLVQAVGMEPTQFESTGELLFQVHSSLDNNTLALSLDGKNTNVRSRLVDVNKAGNSFFKAAADRSTITTQRMIIENNLHAVSVTAPMFVTNPMDTMVINSTTDLTMKGFSTTSLKAVNGDVTITAQNDVVFDILYDFGASYLAFQHPGHMTLDLSATGVLPSNVTFTAADEALRLCACPNGRVYTSHLDFTCEEVFPQYLADPCA